MNVRAYARIAGALFLLSFVAGGLGEFIAPSLLIVPADAAATANNVRTSGAVFRVGFAGYLVEALCDISLTLILYLLLRPVRRDLALLAAFFRLVATATFAFTELFYLAPLLILGGADYLKTFSPEQLNSLALLSFKVYGFGAGAFMVFYGVPSMLIGYLIYRSGYLPRMLGVLMAASGLGFVISDAALILAPAYASPFLLLPAPLAALALAAWLLVKGVDVPEFEEAAARAGYGAAPG